MKYVCYDSILGDTEDLLGSEVVGVSTCSVMCFNEVEGRKSLCQRLLKSGAGRSYTEAFCMYICK